MRLNAFIAKSGFSSRRKAVSFIKEGRVEVNGRFMREPGYEVRENDKISVDGRPLKLQQYTYLIVNKPKGVATTLEDRFQKRKITDLIPGKYGRLYPVGRLDKDSRGLIILTNDGDLCYNLTHPKFEVEKEYIAHLEGKVTQDTLLRFKRGIRDKGELLKVKSASIINSRPNSSTIKVIISEGKKRHLRRLFTFLGFEVIDLKRVRIGSLKLGTLKEGAYREIPKEAIIKNARLK